MEILIIIGIWLGCGLIGVRLSLELGAIKIKDIIYLILAGPITLIISVILLLEPFLNKEIKLKNK